MKTVWPGVTDLANYKSTFPKWKPQDLNKVFPTLPYDAIDLLKVWIAIIFLSTDAKIDSLYVLMLFNFLF